jgi:hypothetical protein
VEKLVTMATASLVMAALLAKSSSCTPGETVTRHQPSANASSAQRDSRAGSAQWTRVDQSQLSLLRKQVQSFRMRSLGAKGESKQSKTPSVPTPQRFPSSRATVSPHGRSTVMTTNSDEPGLLDPKIDVVAERVLCGLPLTPSTATKRSRGPGRPPRWVSR